MVLDILEDFGISSDALQCMTFKDELHSVPAYMQRYPASATRSVTQRNSSSMDSGKKLSPSSVSMEITSD